LITEDRLRRKRIYKASKKARHTTAKKEVEEYKKQLSDWRLKKLEKKHSVDEKRKLSADKSKGVKPAEGKPVAK
jgi:hypothetical protein